MQRARGLLDGLLPSTTPESPDAPHESFGHDLTTVVVAMIAEAIMATGKAAGDLTKDERITVHSTLDQLGVFRMRKGVKALAARLGISRVTAYAYLAEARTS